MKENVAIIIQKLNGGGAERTASNLSVFLSKYYNIHLIVFDGREILYPYSGMLHNLKLYPTTGKFHKFFTLIKRAKAIKKIKKEYNITAAISLMDGANIVNCMSSNGERVITSVRIQMSKSRFNSSVSKFLNKKKMGWISKKSDIIVALSDGVKTDLIENFKISQKKIVTIYNPCDAELLKSKAEFHGEEARNMADLSVTTMGRLVEQKGQWHLIRAFSQVIKAIPDAKLYILGDGPLKEKLKKIVVDLRLESNVSFLGYIEAPHAYIMNSKVFVFPSLFEGLGNVLLEAMACGTPVISADCYSGPREIISPGTNVKESLETIELGTYGILTSVGKEIEFNADAPLSSDEIQLSDAIKLLLTNEQQRTYYAEQAINRSREFLPHVIMKQWVKVIG